MPGFSSLFYHYLRTAIYSKLWKLLYLAKAELLQVGNFFALNFLPWEVLLMKKLEIDKAKPTCYISFKRCILVGLSLLDFQLFYEKKKIPREGN